MLKKWRRNGEKITPIYFLCKLLATMHILGFNPARYQRTEELIGFHFLIAFGKIAK